VPEGRIRLDAEALLRQVPVRKLVSLVGSPAVTVDEARLPVAADPRVRRHRLRSRMALLLAIVLLRLPFPWAIGVVSALRRPARKPATVETTAEVLSAIDHAARWCPCRVACLEQALAAVLASAFGGLRLDWAIGVAEDPYRFHAWVEAEGQAVVPADDAGFSDFRRVLVM
jgi:hypothetical protein